MCEFIGKSSAPKGTILGLFPSESVSVLPPAEIPATERLQNGSRFDAPPGSLGHHTLSPQAFILAIRIGYIQLGPAGVRSDMASGCTSRGFESPTFWVCVTHLVSRSPHGLWSGTQDF